MPHHRSPSSFCRPGLLCSAWTGCLLAVLAAAAAAEPAGRPLPEDARIARGQLPNGVKWVFRRHAEPPGKLALMLHVRTGSLNETDEQRGLAHFIEHMVFNGTEHFPPGALVPYFESIGMEFGADLNATTSFERTGYSLWLPGVDVAGIEKALTVLSDYAFRATFDDKEVEEERGVILAEARSRKSAAQRVRDRLLPDLFKGLRFASRMPIGVEDIVANAPRGELIKYYRTWYRPERTTLIVVGDVDAETIVPLVAKWFGEYAPDTFPKRPPEESFTPYAEGRAIVVGDPELTSCTVQLCALHPRRAAAVTVGQYRTELIERIISRILARRWDAQIKGGNAPYQTAEASVDNLFDQVLTVSATAVGEAKAWPEMLGGLIAELKRACRYGVTARELELATREALSAAERAARTEPTVDFRAVARTLFESTNEYRPVMSAQQELDLLEEILPSLSVGEVSQLLKARFDRTDYMYVLMSPERAEASLPSAEQIMKAAAQAWNVEVEPPAGDEGAARLLAAKPAPGRIVETTTEDDLAVTHAWLENGIRVHHRMMSEKKDQVLVSINLAGGAIEETAENIGVSFAAALAITDPATERLTSSQIRDLGIGRNVKLGGGPVEDDCFTLRIAGSRDDLEFGLQLAYVVLTEGRVEEPVFAAWKARTRRRLEQNVSDVSSRASDALGDLLSGGDPRRSTTKLDQLERLTLEQGQAWFDRLRREAPIEVAIVGDIGWDKTATLVEQYLGPLSSRRRDAAHLDPLRLLARPTGPLTRQVEVPTATPAAVAYAGFAGCDGRELKDRRALQLAENILTTRLTKRIREELGLVYSVSVSSVSGWVYQDSGTFRAGAKCGPADVDRVLDEVQAAFRSFAEQGPTPDELGTAKKQVLNQLDQSLREPQYWAGLLGQMDLRGRSLEEARTHRARYTALTAETVRETFRKYFTPERQFAVSARPQMPTTPGS